MNRRPAHLPARILIVDDERQNRQVLEAMLTPEGYVIDLAASGEEALTRVAEQPPDLLLLDVSMPGMDGYAVAARLKADAATENIIVIMVTALDAQSARMRGLQVGAEDFLTKPVDRAELCVRVRNLLRLKAYGDYHDTYSQQLEGEVGQHQAELVENERLYRATFDAAPVGIIHVAQGGSILRANQRLCDLLGFGHDELQQLNIQELMDPDEVARQVEPFARLATGAIDRHVIDEARYRRRDGSFMWARCNISAYRDAEGVLQHFVAVLEDITERRMLEVQVRQASKMDAIGRLASGVAHDFNNLLTVILGFADLMSSDATLQEYHRQDLAEILKAAGRASGLTGQLLAFSRQQVLHAVPIDVNELITEMTGMLTRLIGEHVSVALALAPHLALAHADRSQVEQVVMNLVVNARDAMPDGGLLTIETSDIEVDALAAQDAQAAHDSTEPMLPGRYVQIAVTDTGTGMTTETQRRLFEPFYTTKEAGKGTGLGLSTIYGIVKQSQGYIWVKSELGHGTTFTVCMPRSLIQTIAQEVSASAFEETPASETVLLVEDEVAVRALSRRILDSAGYRVLEAINGDDAERVFADHAGTIDLLVTDLVMPGCGGLELLERLQTRLPNLRVLYMSGYADEFPLLKMGAAGGPPFMQKPFTAAELMRQVRAALAR